MDAELYWVYVAESDRKLELGGFRFNLTQPQLSREGFDFCPKTCPSAAP